MARALSPKQEEAIEHLLAGRNQTETAKRIGVNKSRISEWMKNPAFFAALSEGRRERRQGAASMLDAAVPRLIAELLYLATGKELVNPKDPTGPKRYVAKPETRLRAIGSALDRAGVTRVEPATVGDGRGVSPARLEDALDELVGLEGELTAALDALEALDGGSAG